MSWFRRKPKCECQAKKSQWEAERAEYRVFIRDQVRDPFLRGELSKYELLRLGQTTEPDAKIHIPGKLVPTESLKPLEPLDPEEIGETQGFISGSSCITASSDALLNASIDKA